MAEIGLRAFIDESGQRARTALSSPHFVMSAAVVPDDRLPDAAEILRRLRQDIGRGPDHELSWKNIRSHSQRLHTARSLAGLDYMTVSSVVVLKDFLPDRKMNDDAAYLYTLRFLLERLSWLAGESDRIISYTLAHVVRFRLATLRTYEDRLRNDPDCRIAWSALDPRGGSVDQPRRNEMLQLGDLVASATGAAFNPDAFGNTERRYLFELSPRLYRRPGGPVTSYGLKMHPWSDAVRAAYPWVAAL